MAGPSMWWPTPSDPGRWFAPRDILASKQPTPRRARPSAAQDSDPVAVDSVAVDSVAADPVAADRGRRPLDEPRFAALALAAQARGARFEVDPQLSGHNAFLDGGSIVVSPSLLTQPEDMQDWIVAHELAHIVRRHRQRLVVSGLAIVVAIVTLVVLTQTVVAGPAVIAGVLGYQFVHRGFERQADIDAASMTPRPDMRDLTHVIATSGHDLAPSLGQKLISGHPAPAERLELLSLL